MGWLHRRPRRQCLHDGIFALWISCLIAHLPGQSLIHGLHNLQEEHSPLHLSLCQSLALLALIDKSPTACRVGQKRSLLALDRRENPKLNLRNSHSLISKYTLIHSISNHPTLRTSNALSPNQSSLSCNQSRLCTHAKKTTPVHPVNLSDSLVLHTTFRLAPSPLIFSIHTTFPSCSNLAGFRRSGSPSLRLYKSDKRRVFGETYLQVECN